MDDRAKRVEFVRRLMNIGGNLPSVGDMDLVQGPVKPTWKEEMEELLSMDWMTRHRRLTWVRAYSPRRYWTVLQRLGPDQAVDGMASGKKALGTTIALKNVPKKKPKNGGSVGIQKSLCKCFRSACKGCGKGKGA